MATVAREPRKEFWQMTRLGVSASIDIPIPEVVHNILRTHEQAVRQAVKDGKPVPTEVLKDYPDLQKTLDKPQESGIMTSRGEEHGKSYGIPSEPSRLGRESTQLPQRVQAEGIPGVEEVRRVEPELPGYSEPDAPTRRESYEGGSIREPGVESGDSPLDIGVRNRLATSGPKDIILDATSDFGQNLGPAARFDNNLEAIRTLKKLDAEERQATPEEQSTLAKYSGFGDSAFNDAFKGYNQPPAWKARDEQLKELTTTEEYEAIEKSRLNAFYTTPQIVNFMWDTLDKMGINNVSHPRILEPSAGSGRILGLQPKEQAAHSERTAVELDKLTGRMLKQLYPEAGVYVMGYQEAPIPKESIDVAISNVPFGNYPVHDPSFKKDRKKFTRQIHNYFFGKTLEVLRPGGIMAFITSHNTLDAPSAQPIRELISEQADLLSAIRLPKTAFPDTEVITDIIFMRKRMPNEPKGDTTWVESETVEMPSESSYYKPTVNINKYFINNPEMVMGKHTTGGSMYRRDEYTVEATPEFGNLGDRLNRVIDKAPRDVIQESLPQSEVKRATFMPSAQNAKIGARVIGGDGNIFIRRVGDVEKEELSENEKERVKGMLAIRDASKAVVNVQLRNGTNAELSVTQNALNDVYDRYVENYGPLNSSKNGALLKGDPDLPFLLALERDDKDAPAKLLKSIATLTKEKADAIKMPIFSKRTIHGMKEPEVSSDTDAISVSLNETGRLDIKRMAELMGQSEEQLRDSLAQKRMIYKNPLGDWESADKYLTGDVRDKLKVAEAAASAKPEYKANVEALKEVQPEALPPSQISARLGAHWIPSEDINSFVNHLLNPSSGWRGGNYFTYIETLGEWKKDDRVEADSSLQTNEWGTARLPASELIFRILNSKPIEVNDKDADDKSVRNPQETIAAQEKASAIKKEFQDWVWDEPDRAERLARIYNETFNSVRPRIFDGAHQVFPGMAEKWTKWMHAHQRDATWRVVQDRTALLAHEVGFGKTAVMVAGGMELKRLGIADKNVYVVPKATHKQFLDQFKDLYPFANVLFPSESDFSTENRQEFISRAVTGDWDAIILSDTQYRRIPLKPETQMEFLSEEMATIREALEDEEQRGGESGGRRGRGQSKTHKELQKALERANVKLQDAISKSAQVSDDTIYFEDMGIDQLFIDEADMFKNLQFTTKMGRLKGLPNTNSDRAWDMYQKIRMLQRQGDKSGVVFATGTPVANTIAEMYTMMRYLQEPTLEAKGLKHFDAWAKTFGETTESLEQTPTGKYRLTQRFAKFQNAPELSKLWQDVADIRVADEVPGIVKLRPKMVDEQGKHRRNVISSPPDEELLDYMKELAQRADELSGKDPHEDNMLKIANDARLASLDMRMVRPNAKPNPEGKVIVASKKIAEIYRDTDKDKGAQLVFLDLGTPKASDRATVANVVDTDEFEETAEEKKVLRNVYGVLKDHLVAAGIPENEVKFIHDAKTQEQRKRLYDKVNSGEIRVIIGSTGKMGVGVNVQERAAALHHMDAPWRPRDIEQREGRVIRQGNEVYGPKLDENNNVIDAGPGVKIYTYVTERSFDAYMWQAIEAKSKAIKAIMRRDNPPREIEDIDSFTMSAGEAKAVASGNPDVLKAVTLRNSVNRLQMLKASHTDSLVRARSQLQNLPKEIEGINKDIDRIGVDAQKVKPDYKFSSMDIEGKPYYERPLAGDALKQAIEKVPFTPSVDTVMPVGKYRGFDILAENRGSTIGYKIIVKSPDTGSEYSISIPSAELTAAGSMQRIDNRINALPTVLDNKRKDLERGESNIANYRKQAEAPFEYADRMAAMEQELIRLEKKLQGEKVEDTPSDNYIPLEDGEELDGEPAEYRFGIAKAEIIPEMINPKAEARAVEAVIEPVEKTLEVKPPDANIEAIVDSLSEKPSPTIEIEAPKIEKAVVSTPEVPAVPEVELYRTTRGFEEDAALRTELETEQGYKLHAVFETPADAQNAARGLTGQDIRFVKHISTTGVETLEVYAKPPTPPVTPKVTPSSREGMEAFIEEHGRKVAVVKEESKRLGWTDTQYIEQLRAIVKDLSIPKTPQGLETPVATAVNTLLAMGERTVSSGFHGALNNRWTIVFQGKVSNAIATVARKAGLDVGVRTATSGVDFTDISLPNVGMDDIQIATAAFNKFANSLGGVRQPKVATPVPTGKKLITPPVTEPGMPEAGYQPAMVEGVTEKEVRPVGKGEITQISMEEQLKLQQLKAQETEVKEEPEPKPRKERKPKAKRTPKAERPRKERKPKERKPKPIKEKKQPVTVSKGERIPISKLRQISAERSQRAQTLDKRQPHQATISPRDTKRVKGWLGDQGKFDIMGVDNPPSITEPTKMPSSGRPRITQRRGNISGHRPRIR